ncbi:MAG: hypothetical protein KDA74_15080 [Planctomycetaceae bacterium]|nr:hypothetical protein [Planctomycetaceae bacterium]
MICYPILRNLLFGTVMLIAVWSCQPTASDMPAGNATQEKTEAPQQLTSPAEVTAALEARWSLDDIKTYCIPERRVNPMCQNLVTDVGVTWKGTLYENVPTGFKSIRWYGTAVDGGLYEYSLNVSRDDSSWNLEIGNVESFARRPNVAPDPSGQCFIGSAPPEKQETDDTVESGFVKPLNREPLNPE